MTTSPSPWLTAHESADYLRVSVKLIYRAVKTGQLRAAVVGGRRALRFKVEYLDAWLEASSTPREIGGR